MATDPDYDATLHLQYFRRLMAGGNLTREEAVEMTKGYAHACAMAQVMREQASDSESPPEARLKLERE